MQFAGWFLNLQYIEMNLQKFSEWSTTWNLQILDSVSFLPKRASFTKKS